MATETTPCLHGRCWGQICEQCGEEWLLTFNAAGREEDSRVGFANVNEHRMGSGQQGNLAFRKSLHTRIYLPCLAPVPVTTEPPAADPYTGRWYQEHHASPIHNGPTHQSSQANPQHIHPPHHSEGTSSQDIIGPQYYHGQAYAGNYPTEDSIVPWRDTSMTNVTTISHPLDDTASQSQNPDVGDPLLRPSQTTNEVALFHIATESGADSVASSSDIGASPWDTQLQDRDGLWSSPQPPLPWSTYAMREPSGTIANQEDIVEEPPREYDIAHNSEQ